ncbi:hypothetical protein [Alicyclobacillus acidocaldarius]|uniref:Uncharacterized protein n=1 Tax=Alicyclobacillus acidocaldarius subsp. acidocaldarius (strain ATCC 27009 / DSM 446 / BCRC 14685 / JCM 5260 / KCTC 1825 / NBRC 15652 / NCIMB 11725 / NRRL B-14509 / 104-IA) TaxID=521098 RepID=C8WYE5_ALIAD|nr:hypothetical protein [Alicyclobacillus acidocaldarius]ACV60039.1 hypothetical protein Aaci_3036 [Alicyclobacillus acidocaldarius subsp. acidocaldarius DSM 446]
MAKRMHPVNKLNLEMLKNSNDPLDMLRQWGILMSTVYETLTQLTMNEDDELVTEYLSGIEELDDKIQEYLYEEAAARIAHFDERTSKVVFDQWPTGLCLVPSNFGFEIRNLPVWMLGHGAKRKHHPLYHRDRPFIRRRQLWYWLVHELKWNYLNSVASWDDSLLPKNPPRYAHMNIRFMSRNDYEIRDLDNYVVSLPMIVNALVANGLIQSDRPGYFTYSVEWVQKHEQDEVQEPTTTLRVRYLERPNVSTL